MAITSETIGNFRIHLNHDRRGGKRPSPNPDQKIVPGKGRIVDFTDPLNPDRTVVYIIKGNQVEGYTVDNKTGEEAKI